MLVGAPGRNEALVFQREYCDGPCWTPAGALNGDAFGGINSQARLGGALAMSSDGKAAVLGASGENTAGELAGCAFVYEETGGIWRTGAQLLADDAADNDLFGSAVAMSPDGSIVVVGARGRDEPPRFGTMMVTDCGAAYVFMRGSGSNGWARNTQQKLLGFPAPIGGDAFGTAVAVSSSGTVVVGTPMHNSGGGAVYVYRRAGNHWLARQKLDGVGESLSGAPGSSNRPGLGNALAFSLNPADTLVASASSDSLSSVQRNAGSVYVYTRRAEPDGNETWMIGVHLTAGEDAKGYDFFGISVAMSADGTSVAVGAYNADVMRIDPVAGPFLTANTGMGYLFTLVNTTRCGPEQRAARSAFVSGCKDDLDFRDQFGQPCSMWALPGYDCTTAQVVHYYSLMGQEAIIENCLEACGRCQEMDACALDVKLQMTLSASDQGAGDLYGSSVAVDGDATVVLVGAPDADMLEPWPDPTVSLVNPLDHGVAYAHVCACPRLIINHSSATEQAPCFAPVRGGECFFRCSQGYVVTSDASKASDLAAISKPRAFSQAPHQAGAVACHGMGRMTARWDRAECTEVTCPVHSHGATMTAGPEPNSWTDPGGQKCFCDQGYSGLIQWNITTGEWYGECIALPCQPVLIPMSDREAAACTAVTAQYCSYRCDASYRAHAGTTETGEEYRSHTGYTEAPGGQTPWSSPTGRALCTPAGVFVYTGCFSVPCPMHGRLEPDRKGCTCEEGFAGDVTWMEDTAATWSEECVGEWVVAAGSRAWLFNVVALGAILLGGVRGCKYCKDKHPELLERRPEVVLGPLPGELAAIAEKEEKKRQKEERRLTQLSSGDAKVRSALVKLRVLHAVADEDPSAPASPVAGEGVSEQMDTGQPEEALQRNVTFLQPLDLGRKSSDSSAGSGKVKVKVIKKQKKNSGGLALDHHVAAHNSTGKLQLLPLRLSRKTGAAYYVDEQSGEAVWATAPPPPPGSMLAPDGSPYRDLYHSGEFGATHIDMLSAEIQAPGMPDFAFESTHLDRLTNRIAIENPDTGREQASLLSLPPSE